MKGAIILTIEKVANGWFVTSHFEGEYKIQKFAFIDVSKAKAFFLDEFDKLETEDEED